MALTSAGAAKESLRESAQNAWKTGWSGTVSASSAPGWMNGRSRDSERTFVDETLRMMCSGPSSSGWLSPAAAIRSRSAIMVFSWN